MYYPPLKSKKLSLFVLLLINVAFFIAFIDYSNKKLFNRNKISTLVKVDEVKSIERKNFVYYKIHLKSINIEKQWVIEAESADEFAIGKKLFVYYDKNDSSNFSLLPFKQYDYGSYLLILIIDIGLYLSVYIQHNKKQKV